MIDEPEIAQVARREAAVIPLVVPREEIRTVMGPGIEELLGVVAGQGIAPSGPVFTHHARVDPEVFDFEIGIPVPTAVRPEGRVRKGELPATTVARTVYRGPYEGLGDAWRALDDWIAHQGMTPSGDLWECYVSGPESGSDPSEWATELNRPVADGG